MSDCIDTPAVPAVADIPAVPAVAAIPGTWANWSPNDTQGPQDYVPGWPTDDRGTWHIHTGDGGPDGEGTFNTSHNDNGNSSWFHREPGTPGTAEVAAIPGHAEVPAVVCEVVVTSNPVGPGGLPLCLEEDGSTPGQEFPCVWDAAHEGNGQGSSFVLDEVGGTPHYVTDVTTDGSVLTNDALPAAPVATAEVGVPVASNPVGLAETGMDGTGAIVASLAMAAGIVLVVIKRLAMRGAM